LLGEGEGDGVGSSFRRFSWGGLSEELELPESVLSRRFICGGLSEELELPESVSAGSDDSG